MDLATGEGLEPALGGCDVVVDASNNAGRKAAAVGGPGLIVPDGGGVLNVVAFTIDRAGDDGSGFLMKYHRTGGGYYINVGCSDLIVAGKIAVKHGAEIGGLDRRTVRFTDGTAMDTDMIVVAAGYQNMSESVRALFGDGVAAGVGPVWGLDEEGEVRAMWRRTGQPGLWIMGGSLQQCRPYPSTWPCRSRGPGRPGAAVG